MTRKPSPHDYLKRDPEDFERSEVEATLNEHLGTSIDHAREHESLPPPDYVEKGHEFWWDSTFVSWFRQAFDEYRTRVLIAAQMVDTKLAAARARYEEARRNDET